MKYVSRFLLGLLLGCLAGSMQANHIVGGEIELIHVRDSLYEIRLIQYFDEVQEGSSQKNPSPDPFVDIVIFRNGSSLVKASYRLPRVAVQDVKYTDPDCAIGQLETDRVLYADQVVLIPAQYADPAGYYIVWERCCRNAAVQNINNSSGTDVGMTYRLDFPPLIKDGKRFINSSPTILPPLSDYACVDQTYYTDFRGTDFDGDSLVYSLVTPLNSSQAVAVPNPTPKPHQSVVFSDGFDVENMVPGSPSLQISDKGFLTVTPSFTGLFVFSVLVEEYRDGEKIGEVIRDFQMLVIDGCNPPAPPDAQVRLPGEKNFYNEVDTIKFTVADEKCFEFLVTDDVGEIVTFRAEGVNFEQKVEDIFDFTQGFINSDKDTLRVEVCIPDCPYVRHEPFIIDLLAADQACPLPQIDTVRLTIYVEPPPNEAPFFQQDVEKKTITVPAGESYTEDFVGLDTDGDFLTTTFLATDFSPEEYGFSFVQKQNSAGQNEVQLAWDAACLTYDFYHRSTFQMDMVLEDLDQCAVPVADTIHFDFSVDLPPNTDPVVSTGLGSTTTFAQIGSRLEFNVKAKDADNDKVKLWVYSPEVDRQQLGVEFEQKEGTGEVNSRFVWPLDCDVLGIDQTEKFTFYFIAEDEDDCKFPNSDTLKIDVNVVVPFNPKPTFDLYPDYELTVNEPFKLPITAIDPEDDFVTIDLLEGVPVPPSESFHFERVSGKGSATSTLEWTPECSLLGEDFAPQKYNVFFLAWDDRCPIRKYDTLSIVFEIKELEVNYDTFLPANVFTPNGDGINNTFKLTNLPVPEQNLPPDNCEDQFQAITIVDRKGKVVFSSDERNFEWDGGGLPAATYYYSIQYRHNSYRGTISLLY